MHRVVHLFLYLLRFPFVIAVSLSHWISLLWSDENRTDLEQTFLACMFCFLISAHVMVPQRTVSFKCNLMPVHPCACVCIILKWNDKRQIPWRKSRGKNWETKHTSLISTDNLLLFSAKNKFVQTCHMNWLRVQCFV